MKPLKLAIADKDRKFQKMLARLVAETDSDIRICKPVSTSEQLSSLIDEEQPDIVLTGTGLSENVPESGASFIVLSDSTDYTSVRSAFLQGASDYIDRACAENELPASLKNLCGRIREEGIMKSLSHAGDNMRRQLFIHDIFTDIPKSRPSLESINKKYSCSFSEGHYICLFIKLDGIYDTALSGADLSGHIGSIDEMLENSLGPFCSDILLSNKNDGVMAIINFSDDRQEFIEQQLPLIFAYAGNIIKNTKGLHHTLCISSVSEEFYDAGALVDECRKCEWYRLFIGIDRIITINDTKTISPSDSKVIEKYRKELFESFNRLDSKSFEDKFNSFFTLSPDILGSNATMTMLRELRNYVINDNAEILEACNYLEEANNKLSRAMHQPLNAAQYRERVLEVYIEIINTICEYPQVSTLRILRQTYAYISRHFAEPITLETMSAVTGLNPGYFSNYFKKTTGKRFTEYLNQYRINEAENLLVTTGRNINEIAESTGFGDSRYFSKVFNKFTGMTPTEYRNRHTVLH